MGTTLWIDRRLDRDSCTEAVRASFERVSPPRVRLSYVGVNHTANGPVTSVWLVMEPFDGAGPRRALAMLLDDLSRALAAMIYVDATDVLDESSATLSRLDQFIAVENGAFYAVTARVMPAAGGTNVLSVNGDRSGWTQIESPFRK